MNFSVSAVGKIQTVLEMFFGAGISSKACSGCGIRLQCTSLIRVNTLIINLHRDPNYGIVKLLLKGEEGGDNLDW